MVKTFKKTILVFLSLLLVISSSLLAPASAFAEEPVWYDQNYFDWFNKVYDKEHANEIFGERYTAAQVQWIFYSLVSLLVANKDFVHCAINGDINTCLDLINPLTNALPKNERSSLASLVFKSKRPISLISYSRNLISKFSIVPEVHAQSPGFGFSGLKVIQDLWSSVRDIVYGLFVLFAVILAFMIMFRVKINPQTIITVQSAIPKLIIALILVTFSYAITGLMVDIMYVFIGLISLMLSSSGEFFAHDPTTIFKFMTTGYVGFNSSLGISLGIFGLFIIYCFLFSIILFFALMGQNGGVAAAITSVFSLGTFPVLVGLLTIIAFIILLLILIWNFFKVIWMLIKTFAQLLLNVVFGPFQIALGVVMPGMGFGQWLKSVIANLAVFPLVGTLLALAFVFINLAASATSDAFKAIKWWDFFSFLSPGLPQLGNLLSFNGWPPLLSGTRGMIGLIYLGISLILITLIPKAVEVIQGFITGKPFAYGTAIGEAIRPVDLSTTGAALYLSKSQGRLPHWLEKRIPLKYTTDEERVKRSILADIYLLLRGKH